jgi:hypothetical protein
MTINTTVGVRAISLLRMLGFERIEIFGMDSCWISNEGHGFAQEENEKDVRFNVWLRPQGRDDKAEMFVCSPWHAKQAEDFLQLMAERADMFELNVHGNGMIAAILRIGAEIEMECESVGVPGNQ